VRLATRLGRICVRLARNSLWDTSAENDGSVPVGCPLVVQPQIFESAPHVPIGRVFVAAADGSDGYVIIELRLGPTRAPRRVIDAGFRIKSGTRLFAN